jgi:hypothetical protein
VTAYTGDVGGFTRLDTVDRIKYTMMDSNVVTRAVRKKYEPLVLGVLTTCVISQRTASIHARADAKLKPATIALRD